jgi:hypothetical protein
MFSHDKRHQPLFIAIYTGPTFESAEALNPAEGSWNDGHVLSIYTPQH